MINVAKWSKPVSAEALLRAADVQATPCPSACLREPASPQLRALYVEIAVEWAVTLLLGQVRMYSQERA